MSWRRVLPYARRRIRGDYVRGTCHPKNGFVVTISPSLLRQLGLGHGTRIALAEGDKEHRGLLQIATAGQEATADNSFLLHNTGRRVDSCRCQLRGALLHRPERMPAQELRWRVEDDALIVALPWITDPQPEATGPSDAGGSIGQTSATGVTAGETASSGGSPSAGGIRRWTVAEDDALRRRWPCEPHDKIAADLGRTVGSCNQRVRKLGVKGPGQGFRYPSRAATVAAQAAALRPAGQARGLTANEASLPVTAAPPPREPIAGKPVAGLPAEPQRTDPRQAEIDRFVAENGVTRCPTVYAGSCAGGDRLAAPPAPRYDSHKKRYTRAGVECAGGPIRPVRRYAGIINRSWTPEEDAELHRRWPSEPHEQIAADLRRTIDACRLRAHKLCIKSRGKGANQPTRQSKLALPHTPAAPVEVDARVAAAPLDTRAKP